MTHDERISSYIDNELTAEQEQEFLISLAASNGLRKSFRSELVMKKVMHQDERASNPPRRLRGAVFAAVGLVGASTLGSEHTASASANAATKTTSAFKALFASKMGTFVTVAAIGGSAMVGYGVRTVTEPAKQIGTQITTPQNAAPQAPLSTPAVSVQTASNPTTEPSALPVASQPVASNTQVQDHHQRTATARRSVHAKSQDPASTKTAADPVSRATGDGSIILNNPTVEKK